MTPKQDDQPRYSVVIPVYQSHASVRELVERLRRVFDEEVHPAHFHLVPCLKYWLWLTREVVISAVDVSKRVLDPKLPISPRAITLPLSQRTDIGRVTYANSITLTPGTVSIDLGEDFVRVHALTSEGAQALIEGEMDRRVTALERGI